jgi:benzoyl-CoA 2,3-epoxidase subunit A
VVGNYRLTAEDCEMTSATSSSTSAPRRCRCWRARAVGIIAPGTDAEGKPHLPRLYSVSSPRDGERPNYNNLALTVKREDEGVCSNYVCDLKLGDEVQVTGPFGSTFLMPERPAARILMICTGTGSAPFRAFTMRRQREMPGRKGATCLFFGARTPELPYFGPLKKVPDRLLKKHLRLQPRSRRREGIRPGPPDANRTPRRPADRAMHGHVYICGLRGDGAGRRSWRSAIAESAACLGLALRDAMRESGRYHVETY